MGLGSGTSAVVVACQLLKFSCGALLYKGVKWGNGSENCVKSDWFRTCKGGGWQDDPCEHNGILVDLFSITLFVDTLLISLLVDLFYIDVCWSYLCFALIQISLLILSI